MRIFSRFAAVAVLLVAVVVIGASDFSKWRGVIKGAEQAMTNRDFDKARTMLEEAEGQAAALGPESSAENSLLLGRAYLRLERLEEMKTTLAAALEKLGTKVRSTKLQAWRGFLLSDYSRAHFFSGDMDGAMTNAVAALEILESIGGRGNNETFFLHSMVGDIQAAKKNYAEAEAAYKKALRIASNETTATGSQWSGSNEQFGLYIFSAPADGKVRAGVSLGNLYLAQGRYAEAESTLATALKEAEAGFGKKGDFTVVALAPLALAEYRLGKLQEFEAHSDRIYQLASKKPGFRLTAIEPFWQKLEMTLQQGNLGEANGTAKKIAALAAAQNVETKWLGERAVAMIATNKPLDWNRARQIHEVISQAGAAQFGAEPVKVAQMQFQFVNFGVQHGRYDFAVAALEQVTKTQEKSPDKTLQLGVCNKMAEIRLAEKKPAEALPYLHQSVELLRAKYGEDTRTAGAMEKEAAALKSLGRDQESEELTGRANEMRAKAIGK